jgi:glutathionylspermidine synthase
VKRRAIDPRPDWRERVEAQGLVFHTTKTEGVYWGEGTFYEFTTSEIDKIAAATHEIQQISLAAVARVVRDQRYAELGLDARSALLVEQSWARRDPALYGRLDLAFGPDGVPKLLEYNADTPTSLLEAAVIQWTWFEEMKLRGDQANALHEKLIERWRVMNTGPLVHFASVDDLEDRMTTGYLRDTAEQAGLATTQIEMTDIGWDPARQCLVDLEGRMISTLFKLYPWEGLTADTLAPALPTISTRWIEPAWKMCLSNKAILPILWEMFPDHPNLLAASRHPIGDAWVKKPLLGREGSNVTIHAPGIDDATSGPYEQNFIYQTYAELGVHDGMHPVIGSWLVGDAPAGIGIRETPGRITSNTARFIPHVIA